MEANREADIADSTKMIENIIREGISNEEVMTTYTEWAKTYDQQVTYDEIKYEGPSTAVNAIIRLYADRKNARILDVCAGTGLMGQMLAKAGFTNVDALDGSKEMLDVAAEKNVYKKCIVQFLGPNRIAIDDNAYDGIMSCGCWHHGHVETGECLPELARVVKPGGKIVLIMDEKDLEKRYRPTMKKMEADGKWKLFEEKEFDSYCLGEKGLAVIFEVC